MKELNLLQYISRLSMSCGLCKRMKSLLTSRVCQVSDFFYRIRYIIQARSIPVFSSHSTHYTQSSIAYKRSRTIAPLPIFKRLNHKSIASRLKHRSNDGLFPALSKLSEALLGLCGLSRRQWRIEKHPEASWSIACSTSSGLSPSHSHSRRRLMTLPGRVLYTPLYELAHLLCCTFRHLASPSCMYISLHIPIYRLPKAGLPIHGFQNIREPPSGKAEKYVQWGLLFYYSAPSYVNTRFLSHYDSLCELMGILDVGWTRRWGARKYMYTLR